ncbi:hypothetical protein SBA1_1520001 [Candidatus Sulfotelmatobacter kueseliae]|uniref:Uncharacterized protein n=1 Tax=Candidatus Sulfotelmatobacter kueseliae TaxID=2042962 RepID=A0A2U3K9Y3_9BACT|nr:hypothetical protein SBA1_1520001 [Candidatus Sulfotelmatobacter kueseliae]
MSDDTTDLLCPHCNATFTAFLHELADQNAKVVCPCCGKAQPPKAAKPVAGGPVKKM